MAKEEISTRPSEFAESVINTVREPLIVLNQDLRVVTVSRSFYEFFQVKPEETVGQLIYNLGNNQWDIPNLRELLEDILPENNHFDSYEVEHDFATIGRRTMLLNARQIERGVGEERIILLAIEDITENKKLEEALKEAYDECEQRVKNRTLELQKSHEQLLHSEKLAAVGKLSASIAHEFNNPLQSVMTIIKGIGRYVPLEKGDAELVDLALQECHRMKTLISSLGDFFQPTSSKLVQVDLHALINDLLLICKKDFQIRNITIAKKYADDIPPVMGVTDQLKQVFLNLFNNAADACEGGGVITITTEKIGGNIAIHIEDNGIGISSTDITHILEPFFTTKPELKGTGLGLSVSYGIIKKHGGRIDVKSDSGKGSIFSVFLPIESVNNE